MQQILITGASGLLGVNVALEAAKDHQVTGISNSLVLNAQAIRSSKFHLIKQDLLAPGAVERLLDQVQPDWVIHCAALANLEACEANPELARQLNSDLPAKLAANVARGGARFLHVSTDAVFDGQTGDYTESDRPNPLSVYARTKLQGEYAVADANPQAIIARVNLFGWSLTGKRSLAEFFFYNLRARKPVMGFTDVFFCPLLANHLGQIFIQMLASDLSGLYHVVCRQAASKYAFGQMLAQKFSLDESLITPSSVAQGGLKAARSPNLTLRSEKLALALNQPLPDLSTGLDGFYALYQQGYPQFLLEMASAGS